MQSKLNLPSMKMVNVNKFLMQLYAENMVNYSVLKNNAENITEFGNKFSPIYLQVGLKLMISILPTMNRHSTLWS